MSTPTTATSLPANSLDGDLLDRWGEIQRSNKALDSPLFSAAFTRAVAAERDGVEIAVIRSDDSVIGFLPYYRLRRSIAAPVAGSFTDFQGVIAAPDTMIDLRQVLRDSRLSAWQFDHLVAANDSLAEFQWASAESPYMDLSQGFESYRRACRANGGKEISELFRKSRKLEREIAPLRFESESTNSRVLDTLVQWKREQLQRMRRPDCFRPAWVRPMLNRILHTHDELCRPMMSALYVGDELAAINFGLRNNAVLHGWITAFNPKYHKFSPGLMLIVKLAESAESLGIRRIDMGRGDESFKRNFCSGATSVAEGAVDRRLFSGSVRRMWVCMKRLLRGTPLCKPAESLLRQGRYASGVLRHSLDSRS